ncbi:MAG: isoprenylcysteine carboxylmethyltransferase family protein [Actinomycetota bacterium]|nr:isoprenylcysteine carboxylmethyltransferase family protein [Actinomycetota bacterium]
MRPLILHDWRATAATVATLVICAVVMRTLWRSRPRLPASGADCGHLRRHIWGLAAVHVLALGAALVTRGFTLPGSGWVVLGAGLVLYVIGQWLRGWAIATLGDWFQGALVVQDGQRLVATGPYRRIRHPAYAGGILRAAGLGLVLDNWLSLTLLVIGMTAFVAVRIRREEGILRSGLAAYSEYEHRTARLVPGVW